MPTITVNGIAVYYTHTGSGEPVVLVHSGGNSGGQWRGVAEALKNRYRLLAVDLYGHGKTGPWPGPAPAGLDALAAPVLALAEAHGRQARKGTGTPYLIHPLGVARLLDAAGCGVETVIAGILHDVIEDSRHH